jgi:hypothetical protein
MENFGVDWLVGSSILSQFSLKLHGRAMEDPTTIR